jgi:hypothetical protein
MTDHDRAAMAVDVKDVATPELVADDLLQGGTGGEASGFVPFGRIDAPMAVVLAILFQGLADDDCLGQGQDQREGKTCETITPWSDLDAVR